MDLELAGKVILVTGGASGIGESIVRCLAEEGAIPLVLDRDAARGKAVIDSVGRGKLFLCDLTDDAELERCAKAVSSEFGGLHGLVNNAGVNDAVGLDRSPADFRKSLETNLVQCYSLAHHLKAPLIQAKGSILNIGSKVAFTGQGGTSGYAAAKGGLAALTREWALDLAADGVRVNALIPAEVWTPMYAAWIESQANSEARRAEIERRIPLEGRMTTPEEIAAMAVFILSPLSSHTTAQIIHVDGGYAHLDRAYSSSSGTAS